MKPFTVIACIMTSLMYALQFETTNHKVDPDELARQQGQWEAAEKQYRDRINYRLLKVAAKEKEKHTTITKRCLMLRKNLAILEYGYPVYRDKNGDLQLHWLFDAYKDERDYLDDDKMGKEIIRARDEITANCGDPDDPQAQLEAIVYLSRTEKCDAARAELEFVNQPQSRAPDSKIQAVRDDVKYWCEGSGPIPEKEIILPRFPQSR